MARRKRTTRTTSRSRRTPWRQGAWTGDTFGVNCIIAEGCEPLFGGAPFRFPVAADPCATQLFFPLLNSGDFGPAPPGGVGLDNQERVTYRGTELHFNIEADERWIADAQELGPGVNGGRLIVPWRAAVFVFDDDETTGQLSSLFDEEWLIRERVLWTTGGTFAFIGGATVDSVQSRNANIRKPVRLTSGQGVYMVWELGCPEVNGTSGSSYNETLIAFGAGPLKLQGWHRTFYVT